MKQIVTQAIVLTRTNYGESDRILTVLTPDYGKVSLLAKGVRKVKSKLAGGIELFSISTITFILGRREVSTLVSTRLVKHFDNIVKDIQRTMLGYELLKRLHRATEDHPGPEYFELLSKTLEGLNDTNLNTELLELWFDAQLIKLGGHQPNLQTDVHNQPLEEDKKYLFNSDAMAFQSSDRGQFSASHIKLLRLAFQAAQPEILGKVTNANEVLTRCKPLITNTRGQFIKT